MSLELGGEGSKYVRMSIDFWYQEDDRSIHITSRDVDGFHTTVKDDPESKRHHGNLYMKLRKVLEAQGRWPQAEAPETTTV